MSTQKSSFWFTPTGLTALGLIGAVSYFLLMEHREHLFQALPYLILLACPLMHFFMHGSHGGHDHGDHKSDDQESFRRGYEEGLRDADHKNRH